jgi:release factor glutamine methyltransferase
VRELLRQGRRALTAARSDTPRLDAELLLADVLGVTRARLVLDAGLALDPAVIGRFEHLVARRAAREPVAYILGRRDFRRISLAVDRRVLIPRPETELLVEVGLGLAGGARVLDVGTGSGAVALALKQERPDLRVSAIDIDPAALALARENASRLGLAVRFAQADLLDEAAYDAVLANLPYVARGSPLPPEVALYEPGRALFAGEDGLDLVRRLVALAGGIPVVALEVGFDQAPAVSELLRRSGCSSTERLRDLAGHERVIVGRR